MKTITVLATSLLLSTSLFGNDAAIDQRMDAMKNIGGANRDLVNISRGRASFDAAVVQSAAAVLSENSGQYFLDLFPVGSTASRSDARGTVWSNWDRFSQLSYDLNTAAKKLTSATEDDFAKLYRDVSITCSTCHKEFRK